LLGRRIFVMARGDSKTYTSVKDSSF